MKLKYLVINNVYGFALECHMKKRISIWLWHFFVLSYVNLNTGCIFTPHSVTISYHVSNLFRKWILHSLSPKVQT